MSFSGVLNRNDNKDTYVLGGRGPFLNSHTGYTHNRPALCQHEPMLPRGGLGKIRLKTSGESPLGDEYRP